MPADTPNEALDAPPDPPAGLVARLATLFALAGGVMLLVTACFTTASVLKRWATSNSIPGDFELVQIGGGLAVFGFLAYGTLMKSNILVDSFSNWLPRRVTDLIDAFWTFVWAVIAVALAERMTVGAREMLANNTETMVLAMRTWWAVGVGAAAFALTGVVALWWTLRLLRGIR